jgi:membrane dipeptidase
MLRFVYNNHIYDDEFKKLFEKGGMYGHVDLPRLKKGKNGGAFWSAYGPCPKNRTDFSDENYADCKSMLSSHSVKRHRARANGLLISSI